MSGHWGDLSDEQQRKLQEFQTKLPQGAKTNSYHAFLRFLRAREWDVNAASEMYANFLSWRNKSNMDHILDNPPPKADTYMKLIPHVYHGFDKQGRPVLFERIGNVDWDLLEAYLTDEQLMCNHLWEIEYSARRCRESSQRSGKHVETFTRIVDLTGLNLSGRKGLKFIRMCAANDQNYYPERLGRVIVINAPSVFPVFWKMAKRWLNPVTASKVEVCGADYKETLLKFIDAENLPEEFGGSCKGSCRNIRGRCLPAYDTAALKHQLKHGNDPFDSIKHLDLTVGARKAVELRLFASDAGGKFDWNFKTVSNDVTFSVNVFEPPAGYDPPALTAPTSPKNKEEKGEEEEKKHISVPTSQIIINGKSDVDMKAWKKVEIVPSGKVKNHQGSYLASAPNSVMVLRFDNTHSILTSKKLRYSASVEEVFDEATQREAEVLSGTDEKSSE